jgi:hypothetical protein
MVNISHSALFREREVEAFLPTPEQLKRFVEEFNRRTGCVWFPGVDYKVQNAPALRCRHMSVPVGRIQRVLEGRPRAGLTMQTTAGVKATAEMHTLEDLHNHAVKTLRRRRALAPTARGMNNHVHRGGKGIPG